MLLAGVLALAAGFVLGSPPALADDGDALPGGVPTGSTVEVVHRCVLYASASSFGADCAGGDGATSIKDVLGDEKFPECRYDPIPDDVPYDETAHQGEAGAWYLETCLKGIKPNGTGDFERVTQARWFPADNPPPQLTDRQRRAWSFFRSAYPVPQPQFGPASLPRVLIPTFFWLTDDTGTTIQRTVFDGVRNVPMRARVEQLEVSPGRYSDEKPLVCPGRGTPYDHSRDIYGQVSTCRYEYDRSSAFMPTQRFDVGVTADWVVEYQLPDGSWKRLGMFPLSNAFQTPVQEIQTVAR